MAALPWPLGVPVLSDGVVTLRAHTRDDVEPMWEMAQDPEMQRWTAIPVPHTRAMSEQFALEHVPRGWDEGTARGWAIETTEGGGARYAGNVDVRGGVVADLGFALHPWARGRGVMARAVRLALDWSFTEGSTEAIHWRSQVGNEASLRVAHACGFRLHGTVPGLLHERGVVHDAWTASLSFGEPPLARTRWADAPVLETARVLLRPLRHDDAPRVVEACSDPVTRHWLAGLPTPYTPASARDFVHDCVWNAATGTKLTWAVADPEDDRLLALVTIMDLQGLNPSTAELGYWAHPDARGRGVVTDAVRLAVEHAFAADGLGLQRLSLLAAASNLASNQVAERVGFRRVGVERQAERLGDGSLDDLVCHDLLRTDLR